MISTQMKSYRIPQSDLIVSRLALGCAVLDIDWNDPDFIAKTVPLIRTAYEQGITLFDLADIYGQGEAETAVGKVLKEHPEWRHRIVIQSKCGDRLREGWVVDNSCEYILRSVESSLKRLGVEYLDVLLLHWHDTLAEPEEVAQAFSKLLRSGKVRYFGVSNHNPSQIELLKKSIEQPLVANQIRLGLGHWYVAPEPWKAVFTHGDMGAATLDYCRLHEIQIQAYSPLRLGGVKPSNLLSPAVDASEQVKQATQMLVNLARQYEVTPAAIMLAWLLRHPAGIVPIIGGIYPQHLVENCAADRVELTRAEWYSLLHAATAIHTPALLGNR